MHEYNIRLDWVSQPIGSRKGGRFMEWEIGMKTRKINGLRGKVTEKFCAK